MVNAHRNEFVIEVGGVKKTVRATLSVLEEYEERFMDEKPRPSLYYRIVGWLLSRSENPVTEDEGSEIAFGAGLEKSQEIFTRFLEVAYKTGEEAPGKPKKAKK